jgi:hypothetical protein
MFGVAASLVLDDPQKGAVPRWVWRWAAVILKAEDPAGILRARRVGGGAVRGGAVIAGAHHHLVLAGVGGCRKRTATATVASKPHRAIAAE